MIRFALVVLVVLAIYTVKDRMATASGIEHGITLDTVRDVLVRQEDTIVFGLIERAKFPLNSNTYDDNYAKIPGFCGSLVDFFVKNTEELQAKVNNLILLYSIMSSYLFSCLLLNPHLNPSNCRIR